MYLRIGVGVGSYVIMPHLEQDPRWRDWRLLGPEYVDQLDALTLEELNGE
jgi:hypothetical protein